MKSILTKNFAKMSSEIFIWKTLVRLRRSFRRFLMARNTIKIVRTAENASRYANQDSDGSNEWLRSIFMVLS